MSDNEIRDFIFENHYKRIEFFKENNYHSMKRLKKDFLLFANKLIEKYLILAIRRNTVSHL